LRFLIIHIQSGLSTIIVDDSIESLLQLASKLSSSQGHRSKQQQRQQQQAAAAADRLVKTHTLFEGAPAVAFGFRHDV